MKIKGFVRTEREIEIPNLFKIEKLSYTTFFKVGEEEYAKIARYDTAGCTYASLRNSSIFNDIYEDDTIVPITEQEWQEAVNALINEIKSM